MAFRPPRSNEYRPVTEDYRLSQVTVASQVQKAIRDGDLLWLPDLVGTQSALLWEPNSSGWTAVHYAASHFLPTEWWDWILMRAACEKPRFWNARNVLGETPIDIFLRSYLQPLPWQSVQVKKRSQYLLEAIDKVCSNPFLIQMVQRGLRHRRSLGSTFEGHPLITQHEPKAVHCCKSFWINLDMLARVAVLGQLDYAAPLNMVAFLAHTGSCPEPLARLALQLFPEQAQDRDTSGLLPIDLWAKSRSSDPSMDGMLKPLLQAYPEAATTRDANGRYPLHVALESGKSWPQIQPLFEAAPHLLECKDVKTRLPCSCLAALAPAGSSQVRARQNSAGEKGLVSLWNLVPSQTKKELLAQASQQLECEQLTTLYHILQAYPQAVTTSKG